MSQGKILISDKSDNYLLKLVGDVRLTLSGTLNRYMEILFGNNQVKSVVVDMLDAEGVDSTTLGLIAKLGLHCRESYQMNVKLFCQNPSIIRTLECMGFDEIIDIFQQSPDEFDTELRSLEEVPAAVDEVRRQVLEAHKLLLKLNPKNSAEFTDLINALEADQ
ncbi:MAG: STAS domain-containing protein [Porticoccaceae bacterium]